MPNSGNGVFMPDEGLRQLFSEGATYRVVSSEPWKRAVTVTKIYLLIYELLGKYATYKQFNFYILIISNISEDYIIISR